MEAGHDRIGDSDSRFDTPDVAVATPGKAHSSWTGTSRAAGGPRRR